MNESIKWALDAAQSIEGRSHPNSTTTDYVQQSIEAATADKDMQIERLKAEFETGLKIIEEKDKRIAAMSELLDRVPHIEGENRCEWYQSGPDEQSHREDCPCNGTGWWCAIDCPRCAWERMKATPGLNLIPAAPKPGNQGALT